MRKIRTLGTAAVMVLWLVLAGFAWFGPRTEISQAERRKLEQLPTFTAESLLDGRFMSKFEKFTQDQFPLRDRFRQLKAIFSYGLFHRGDNNGIYLAEGYAAKLEYPLNLASVAGAVEKFQKLYETYLTGSNRILFCVVPDKGYYLAEKNGYPAMDYPGLFAAMEALPWAQYVDITDCLDISCYYRTDIHWRQETLLPAAEKLSAALGVDTEDAYLPRALERPFYGVYYGQAALPLAPETMYILESDTLEGCTVTNYETGQTGQVYDWTKLNSRDLYDVFLSGAVSVLTIENPAAKENRELIVFRDSFGSSLVPLLVPGYGRITLVDTRYIPADQLGNYVNFADQDVLFLYSPMVLGNSTMLK